MSVTWMSCRRPQRPVRPASSQRAIAVVPILCFVLAAVPARRCVASAVEWACADQRIRISLWSADAVRATQLRCAKDGSLWVMELRGRLLRMIETETGVQTRVVLDLAGQAHSADPELGATSVEFSDDFDGVSGTLYVAHNWDDRAGRRLGAVSRVTVREGALAAVRQVFGPVSSAATHQLDRLVLDGDDLLLSTGDLWQPRLAQLGDSIYGKVIRFKAVSADAELPLVAEVEAKGLRSPFGMARRRDGLVVIANNGADTDDALFVLKRGANYGWGAAIETKHQAPAYLWKQPVSPVGLCFYEASTGSIARHAWPPEYDGNLFVALFKPSTSDERGDRALRNNDVRLGQQVVRFRSGHGCDPVLAREASVFLSYGGKRSESPIDMAVAPSGDLFVLTIDHDPNSHGTSRIYRLRATARPSLDAMGDQ